MTAVDRDSHEPTIASGLEALTIEDHRHILVLSDEILACTSLERLSSTAVNGIASLIDSVSVAWTELDVSAFVQAQQSVMAVDGDVDLDYEHVLAQFDRHATEHPVINAILETGSTLPIAISDELSEDEFAALDLYRSFYADLGIVDQLSVGRVFGNRVVGCSVNRSSRGFADRDRALLNPLGHVIFATYRLLSGANTGTTEDRGPTVSGDPSLFERATSLGLTKRESEILAHLASGKSNKQIAEACELSPGTVRKHTENIYRRLGVNNRVNATLVALDRLR